MKYLFLLIFSSIILSSYSNGQVKQKTILAIFAHPDDEAAVAPVLAKYAKENEVYIIIATENRFWIKPGFPTPDTLKKTRQEESKCACKILGLKPPVFLGFTDSFDIRNNTSAFREQTKQLKGKLTGEIMEINPDVIITFGPDGHTGHADHRFIGDITTEIILTEGWVERFPLYYIGWTKKDVAKYKDPDINTVDLKYLDVSIKYDSLDEQKAIVALSCYKSQLSPVEVKELTDAEMKDLLNVIYFRQLTLSGKQKNDF